MVLRRLLSRKELAARLSGYSDGIRQVAQRRSLGARSDRAIAPSYASAQGDCRAHRHRKLHATAVNSRGGIRPQPLAGNASGSFGLTCRISAVISLCALTSVPRATRAGAAPIVARLDSRNL